LNTIINWGKTVQYENLENPFSIFVRKELGFSGIDNIHHETDENYARYTLSQSAVFSSISQTFST